MCVCARGCVRDGSNLIPVYVVAGQGDLQVYSWPSNLNYRAVHGACITFATNIHG